MHRWVQLNKSMPQLLCLLLCFGLMRYLLCFYVLGDDNILLQVYKPSCFGYLCSMEDSCQIQKLLCRFSPFLSKPVFSGTTSRICQKSYFTKKIISLYPSATMLLRKKHLYYSGVVGKSHRNVLASRRNVAQKMF